MKRVRSQLRGSRAANNGWNKVRKLMQEHGWVLGIAVVSGIFVLWMILTMARSGPSVSSKQPAEWYNEVPGLNLRELTSEQRAQALERMNRDLCTCDCRLTLAQCRNHHSSCTTSLPLCRLVLVDVEKAKPMPPP